MIKPTKLQKEFSGKELIALKSFLEIEDTLIEEKSYGSLIDGTSRYTSDCYFDEGAHLRVDEDIYAAPSDWVVIIKENGNSFGFPTEEIRRFFTVVGEKKPKNMTWEEFLK